jgi:hypothetical protein
MKPDADQRRAALAATFGSPGCAALTVLIDIGFEFHEILAEHSTRFFAIVSNLCLSDQVLTGSRISESTPSPSSGAWISPSPRRGKGESDATVF